MISPFVKPKYIVYSILIFIFVNLKGENDRNVLNSVNKKLGFEV